MYCMMMMADPCSSDERSAGWWGVCCGVTVPLQTWQQKEKHRCARACAAECFFNAHWGSPAHAQTALSPSWLPVANQSSVLWTRTGSWPRTFGSNNLNGNAYVRALVFFVWQRREAPKEWPWLMKNQRWVFLHCINIHVYFSGSVAWRLVEKHKHFHMFCFTLLKLRDKIQLLCMPTLIDRKVRERASTGAQIVFCLIPHSQPAGVILSACLNLPVCVCISAWLVLFKACVCVHLCKWEKVCALSSSKNGYMPLKLQYFLVILVNLCLYQTVANLYWCEFADTETM